MSSKHFKTYITTFAECDSIDDADQVYGVGDAEGWPDVDDACDIAVSGHHEYDIQNPDVCKHCGKRP